MWKSFLKENVFKPGLKRLGTIGATALLVGGDWACARWNACGLVTPDGAEQVMAYVIAVALLAFDLAIEWIDRKRRG